MGEVVVAEHLLLDAGLAHALDHRGMVQLVGQDQTVGQQLGDGRDRRLVGDEAGGEDQRGFLAVQIRQFLLQFHQRVVGAGNVAGTAGARAHGRDGRGHRRDDVRVLAHAEIVVGAPHGDLGGFAVMAPDGLRKPAGNALEIGKDPVAFLGMQSLDRRLELALIIDHPILLVRTFLRAVPVKVHLRPGIRAPCVQLSFCREAKREQGLRRRCADGDRSGAMPGGFAAQRKCRRARR